MGETVERGAEESATTPRTRKRKRKRASEQGGDVVVGSNLGGTRGSCFRALVFPWRGWLLERGVAFKRELLVFADRCSCCHCCSRCSRCCPLFLLWPSLWPPTLTSIQPPRTIPGGAATALLRSSDPRRTRRSIQASSSYSSPLG